MSPLHVFVSHFDTEQCNVCLSTLSHNGDTIREHAKGDAQPYTVVTRQTLTERNPLAFHLLPSDFAL